MTCDELAELLTDYLEGELDSDQEAAAIEHISTCTACDTVLRQTKQVIALTGEHGAEELTEASIASMRSSLLGSLSPGSSN